MSDSSIQSQRLQRVYETAKNSLNISTQVALAGGVAAPATMYHMDISFRSTRNKWSIAKRYSEFYAVRQQLRKFLKQYKQQLGGAPAPTPLLALDKTLEAAFPRRHFRCDNNMIIAERRAALETFVQSLVKIISSIPMAADVAAATTTEAAMTAEAKQLVALYAILRDFLEYPDKQIESETKLKLAVLSLEDVVVDSHSNLLESVEGVSTSEYLPRRVGRRGVRRHERGQAAVHARLPRGVPARVAAGKHSLPHVPGGTDDPRQS